MQDGCRDHVQVERANGAARTGWAGALAIKQHQSAIGTKSTQREGLYASAAVNHETTELVGDLGFGSADGGLLQEFTYVDLALCRVGLGFNGENR
ncbi:hypothetical protein D3C81_1525890 [compost metagenome]